MVGDFLGLSILLLLLNASAGFLICLLYVSVVWITVSLALDKKVGSCGRGFLGDLSYFAEVLINPRYTSSWFETGDSVYNREYTSYIIWYKVFNFMWNTLRVRVIKLRGNKAATVILRIVYAVTLRPLTLILMVYILSMVIWLDVLKAPFIAVKEYNKIVHKKDPNSGNLFSDLFNTLKSWLSD